MQTRSISEIKKELQTLGAPELMALCLRMSKYKVENKELLGYLLFESTDEVLWIQKLSEDISIQFENINHQNVYIFKKQIRKILRLIQKQIKFSGQPKTETELLLIFCQKLLEHSGNYINSPVIQNIYLRQKAKLLKAIAALHEDLQYDYQSQIDGLL